jgi:hypothetical protein
MNPINSSNPSTPVTLKVVNPLDIPNWEELILAFPEYSIFHSAPWSSVLSGSYNYQPLYFTLRDGSRVSAVVPLMEVDSRLTGKRGVSLPFTDSCEPMITEQVSFDEVFEQIKKEGQKRNWNFIELRGGENFLGPVQPFQTFYGHTLNLDPGEKELRARFRTSTSRNMKKAFQSGVRVSMEKKSEAIEEYFRLHALTRKRHGLPPQPFKFFKNIFSQIIAQGKGIIALASYQQKVIAGAVFLFLKHKVIYKFGASDFKYQELRANNLVMGEALCWACREGFKDFDFGRTETDNPGLRQFKKGWGTQEREIKYFRYNLLCNAFVSESGRVNSRLSRQLFKILPKPILNILGRVFYRHMG